MAVTNWRNKPWICIGWRNGLAFALRTLNLRVHATNFNLFTWAFPKTLQQRWTLEGVYLRDEISPLLPSWLSHQGSSGSKEIIKKILLKLLFLVCFINCRWRCWPSYLNTLNRNLSWNNASFLEIWWLRIVSLLLFCMKAVKLLHSVWFLCIARFWFCKTLQFTYFNGACSTMAPSVDTAFSATITTQVK